MIYVIKYFGHVGFIKPISSTRDGKTQTARYLYPSSIIGIERHLFPELSEKNTKKINKILGHRIDYTNISYVEETVQSIAMKIVGKKKKDRQLKYNTNITQRGVMVNPTLSLAFNSKKDAEIARDIHICLSRNEDLMFSDGKIYELNDINDFNNPNEYPGFELEPCIEYFDNSIKEIVSPYIGCSVNDDDILYFGKNKYTQDNQFGKIKQIGEPSFTKYQQELIQK